MEASTQDERNAGERTQAERDERKATVAWILLWIFVSLVFPLICLGARSRFPDFAIHRFYAGFLWLAALSFIFLIYRSGLPENLNFQQLGSLFLSFGPLALLPFLWLRQTHCLFYLIPLLIIAAGAGCFSFRESVWKLCKVEREKIVTLINVAWLVFIVESAAIVFEWFHDISGHEVNPFDPAYFDPVIPNFLRALLVAVVVLFIAEMFNRFEAMSRDAKNAAQGAAEASTSIENNLPTVKEQAKKALEAVQASLNVHAASLHFLQMRQLVEALGASLADGGSAEGGLTVLSGTYQKFALSLKESYMGRIGGLLERAKTAPAPEKVFLLSSLERYLDLDLFSLLPSSTGSPPELKTWFPHYAATVRSITENILELPDGAKRFEFYATLPLKEGPETFFNIGNSGADPLWSIDFLNEFLWDSLAKQKVKYRRYLYRNMDTNHNNYFNQRRICDQTKFGRDSRMILSRKFGDRAKAVPLPSEDFWGKLSGGDKEKYRSLGVPPFDKNVRVLRGENKDAPLAFIIRENPNGGLQTAATELGLEFAKLLDVLDEYPPPVCGSSKTGNYLCDIESPGKFEELFPQGQFYDLYAVRDTRNGGRWVVCIAAQWESSNSDVIRERLYCDSISGSDRSWETLKKTLDQLFVTRNGATLEPLLNGHDRRGGS